jgi:imidazolonepropionase-like amidohydrolase
MEEHTVAVTGDFLFDGTEKEPINSGCVIMKGDRIVYSGPQKSCSIPEDAEVIDGSGCAVIPGIIDGHMHLTGSPAKLDTQGHLTHNIRAIRKLRTSMFHGVTTVVNVGGCPESQVLKDSIEEDYLPPMARMLIGGMMNSTGGHVRGYAGDGPWGVRKAVRHLAAGGADCIKSAAGGGFMWKHERLDLLDYTLEELRALTGEAHAKGKKVQIHAHAQPALNLVIQAGCDIILHGALIDQEALDGISDRNLSYMPTLYITSEKSYSRSHLPDHMVKRMKHANPIHREGVRRAIEMGIRLSLGTDGGPGDAVTEMNYLCDCGALPLQVLRIGTGDTAKALGVDEEIGTLEPGKKADLVLLDKRVLEDISVMEDPENIGIVFVNGRRMVVSPEMAGYYRPDHSA